MSEQHESQPQSQDVNWCLQALHGARIIDNLLVLFALWTKDYNAVDEALAYVAEASRVPGQPLSVRLAQVLRERKLIL